MKIIKYKYLKNSKYEILIDDKNYILYEDVILKNNLLLNKEITKEQLQKYLEENNYYEAYYSTIKYLKKMRSSKETERYLNANYPKYTKDILKKLTTLNLIDDKKYVEIYTNDMIFLKDIGPYKIANNLQSIGINKDDISKVFTIYKENIEQEKIDKILSKKQKTFKGSKLLFINKMRYFLKEQGFSIDIIEQRLKQINYNDKDSYQKEYEKNYNKLSKKYQGKELEQRLKQKMYQLGYYDQ